MPTPSLLERAVTMIADIPMEDRDTKGDLYEYLLSKIAQAGVNGQFRTPRHIIKLMVELMAPQPKDVIGDPACGTCGFLVAAGEFLREHHKTLFVNKSQREHFQTQMFHGSDFDASMLRIGAMNMMLHGVEQPDIQRIDSLSQDDGGHLRDRFTLVLANPPFKGSLDHAAVAKDLLQMTKTKKTELLFLALFLAQLKPGGRCACIVPDGVLFGSSTAHQQIRQTLVDGHKLDGVISMPSGVFKPYAGVSTAILLFTKTNSGGTDHVWFYDMTADGFSLDDKRDNVYTNFEDELGEAKTVEGLIKRDDSLKNYRLKVERFVREHEDHPTIAHLKHNQPITAADLEALEAILFSAEAAGNRERFQQIYGTDKPLGKLIREIVGLDPNSAKQAFAQFLILGTLNADQITFINQIIDHLIHNGTMDPADLFKPPFTDMHDKGLIGVLPQLSQAVVQAIRQINENALAA